MVRYFRNKKGSQQGSSILNLVVSFGLLGFLALLTAKLQSRSVSNLIDSKQDAQWIEYVQMVDRYLIKPDLCNSLISGLTVDGSNQDFQVKRLNNSVLISKNMKRSGLKITDLDIQLNVNTTTKVHFSTITLKAMKDSPRKGPKIGKQNYEKKFYLNITEDNLGNLSCGAKNEATSSPPITECSIGVRSTKYSNINEVKTKAGDSSAFQAIGTPEPTEPSSWWGIRCVNDHTMLGCEMTTGGGTKEYDTQSQPDSCVTDGSLNEIVHFFVTCCK